MYERAGFRNRYTGKYSTTPSPQTAISTEETRIPDGRSETHTTAIFSSRQSFRKVNPCLCHKIQLFIDTDTILSSQSFNFHHWLRVQALRSPVSAGLPDYSDEQFQQRDKAVFLRSFIIFALKGYGRISCSSPGCAAMWWKGWLWLAVASRGSAHVFST